MISSYEFIEKSINVLNMYPGFFKNNDFVVNFVDFLKLLPHDLVFFFHGQ